MSSNRTIVLQLDKIITLVTEKIRSGDLQKFICDEIDKLETDILMYAFLDNLLKSPDNLSEFKSYDELKTNIQNGVVHNMIVKYFVDFKKALDDGSVQSTLEKMLDQIYHNIGGNPTDTHKDMDSDKPNKKNKRDDKDDDTDIPNKRKK